MAKKSAVLDRPPPTAVAPAADVPQYQKPSDDILAAAAQFDPSTVRAPEAVEPLPEHLQEAIRNCNHCVLDRRDGVWKLFVIGGPKSGVEIAAFGSRPEGVKWLNAHGVHSRVTPGGPD